MTSYNLITLLKVRMQNKEMAEHSLLMAKRHLEEEQNKLELIKAQLAQKKLDRAHMQNQFFQRAQHEPCNKREVTSLAFSAQKNIYDEQSLKNSLIEQLQNVKNAEFLRNAANKEALAAQRDLKAISKHHVKWQQREKKNEDLKVEYDADDQNGLRFWLKKRA